MRLSYTVEAKDTKEKLLNSAFKLFSKKGYENTTLEQICEKAKVTRGAAYWYFDNKRSIYKQLLDDVLTDIDNEKLKIMATNKLTSHQKLVELIFMPHIMWDHFQFTVLFIVPIQTNKDMIEFQEMIQSARIRLIEYFKELLVEVVKSNGNEVDEEKLEDTTMMLYLMFEGMYLGVNSSKLLANITKESIVNFVNLIIDIPIKK